MAKEPFSDLMHTLRRMFPSETDDVRTDDELLNRFVAKHDEDAFTALVHRHGRMILGVCRRLLGDHHLAEDAFQATFIVLARRAASIRSRTSVGTWLHAVARRVAMSAKQKATATRNREREAGNMPRADRLDEHTWQELRSIIDEEIGRLPEKYQAPIVLCHLEGKSHNRAAQELGCAKTTLEARLSRGQALLRRQLIRRGVTLSAAALTTALCEKVMGAPVAALLTINTVKAVAGVMSGKALAGACITAQVLTLAEEAMVGMMSIKTKLVVMVLALGLAVGGASVAGYGALGGASQQNSEPKEAQPKDDGERARDKKAEPPWGDEVGGWRMRLTLPAGAEYRRHAPLSIHLEVQNVSTGPLALPSGWSPDPEVTVGGKKPIVRELIDITPWEGRRHQVPAGATLKWTMDFDRLRFSQPLKAGTSLQLRFRRTMPTQALPLGSNEVALKLKDDHPSIMTVAADLPPKWTDSMALVYRENVPFAGYRALRIDGEGRAWLVTIGLEKGKSTGLIRTEVELNRERLDRLVKFLHDRKVWELAGLSLDEISYPDESDIRISIGVGKGSLVRVFPEHVVRDQPKLLALKAEMHAIIDEVLQAAAKPKEDASQPEKRPSENKQVQKDKKERKDPNVDEAEKAKPEDNFSDRKLKAAFGKDCKELKRPYRLWLASLRMVIAADSMNLDGIGKVKLTVCSVAAFAEKEGDGPALTAIRSDWVSLTFDGPVTQAGDLSNCKIVAIEMSGFPMKNKEGKTVHEAKRSP